MVRILPQRLNFGRTRKLGSSPAGFELNYGVRKILVRSMIIEIDIKPGPSMLRASGLGSGS